MAKLLKIPSYGKRKSVKSSKECQIDLKESLPVFFSAFDDALKLFNKEVVQTPVYARCRGFEANLLNSKMIQCIQDKFPEDWFFGKYKRFIVRKDGYIILFKKLNSKNLPMNVRTKNVVDIENQVMKSLFEEMEDIFEPVVFFGYRRDRFGNIGSPKLVYIDEGKCKFELTEKDILREHITTNSVSFSSNTPMKLKDGVLKKKTASDE